MIRSKHFRYCKERLFCESVDLANLPSMLPASEYHVTTPVYVYSRTQLEDNINSYKNAFQKRDHIIGFALKVQM